MITFIVTHTHYYANEEKYNFLSHRVLMSVDELIHANVSCIEPNTQMSALITVTITISTY